VETNKSIGIIGLGWLGASLANELQTLGWRVWGTHTQDSAKYPVNPSVKTLQWESDKGFLKLKPYLETLRFLIITIPPSKFEASDYGQLMEGILKNAPNKTRFIYTSSIGIYPKTAGNFSENDDVDTTSNLYRAEQVFITHAPERSAILRLGGLIGNDRNPVHFLVEKENNDPDGRVHLVDKKDVISSIIRVMDSEKSGVWNLVNPEKRSRKEYYTKLARHLNLSEPLFTQKETELTDRIIISTSFGDEFDYTSFRPLFNFD
jgi:nucleoside-diphosphate-sugar epimerase